MSSLLITNGYLIDPRSGREGLCDILIEGDRIVKITGGDINRVDSSGEPDMQPADSGPGTQNQLEPPCSIIDARGLIVAPGLVDVHVHFREPGFTHKEDIDTGARAAAKGGFTTVVLMANTNPAADNPETLAYIISRSRETPIHITTCANVTLGMQGRELAPLEELADCGAVGFTDDGKPLLDEELVREAMSRARALDLPISFHEEDPALISENGIHRGKASAHFGIGGSPREAESSLVERDLELALETGARINIQHISTKEAVEAVRRAKKLGGDIHAEATPHHFTLTEEAVIRYGSLAKMNPPLREEADRQAIIKGLQDGTIDLIATDHAPHTAEEKSVSITEAPSGIIGLETALALGVTELVEKGHLTMCELLRRMSTNPAKLYHLEAGYLEEGGPADLILIDPREEVIPGDYASKASNTPFTGWKLRGAVKTTICGGKVVYSQTSEDEEQI